jgi:hypothetical protein
MLELNDRAKRLLAEVRKPMCGIDAAQKAELLNAAQKRIHKQPHSHSDSGDDDSGVTSTTVVGTGGTMHREAAPAVATEVSRPACYILLMCHACMHACMSYSSCVMQRGLALLATATAVVNRLMHACHLLSLLPCALSAS